MLDTKTKLVLKILAKESSGGSYKIFESADIISLLPKRYRTDSTGIRQILTHLERQDMISIKYDDDDTYCLAVLPFGYEEIEEHPSERKQGKSSKWIILISFISALFGAIIGVIATYFLTKLF